MLDKVEQAQRNIEMARATYAGYEGTGLLSQDEGKIGMLSKMGGRMMHYYSEELVDMLLDDML